MLHVHFGAGRLGLGLVAPFFQTTGSELYILNRAVSSRKATGETGLSSARRNQLLSGNPGKLYVIEPPGGQSGQRQEVHYDGFFAYDDDTSDDILQAILDASRAKRDGIVVTASLLVAENYRPVLRLLHLAAECDEVGPLFLVACENTLSAYQVLEERILCEAVSDQVRAHVTCVHALVDRVCVGLEEDTKGKHPAVLVRAEEYGSLKLELRDGTKALAQALEGSKVEFTRHVHTEKQVKNWLLNGSHWLIALAAFNESKGDQMLKLNEFLSASPERKEFASRLMSEMSEGVAVILRSDPRYADFVDEVDPDRYLHGASRAILGRFLQNEDPIKRILARFQAPSPEAPGSVETFSKRLSDRVDEPIRAYQEKTGTPPAAASQSVHSLLRLLASGTFIDAQRG